MQWEQGNGEVKAGWQRFLWQSTSSDDTTVWECSSVAPASENIPAEPKGGR